MRGSTEIGPLPRRDTRQHADQGGPPVLAGAPPASSIPRTLSFPCRVSLLFVRPRNQRASSLFLSTFLCPLLAPLASFLATISISVSRPDPPPRNRPRSIVHQDVAAHPRASRPLKVPECKCSSRGTSRGTAYFYWQVVNEATSTGVCVYSRGKRTRGASSVAYGV